MTRFGINLEYAPFMRSLHKWLRVLIREFNEEGLKFRAMSLVYTTLLSLAPLLAVSFSILKGFGVHNQIQPLLLELLSPLGEKAIEVTTNLIYFVEHLQVGVLGFVGFLMLFYTAISLVDQIESCFNYIWRITKPRSLYRRFSDYLSVILIGPVLLFSALGIAASMGSTAIVQQLIALEPFGTVYYLAGTILPYLLTVAAFTFVYSFIPNTEVKPVPALIGGLLAGLSWKLTGLFFGLFIGNSTQYSAVYSGFAVILLSMIWLYISWLILLLGGVIAFHIQYPNYLNYTSRRPHLSQLSQEQLSLVLMYLVARHHINREAVCTLKYLADAVNLPWEPVADLLDCLKGGGLLVTLDGEVKAYLPARDTDAILLRDIVHTVRNAGDQLQIARLDPTNNNLNNFLDKLNQTSQLVLADQTLRDLLNIGKPVSDCAKQRK
ncbi:MAG: YhjD/YihY/BrkB family envelope integrity protein [Methylococcales bacterium]